jgi:hypothetical protein
VVKVQAGLGKSIEKIVETFNFWSAAIQEISVQLHYQADKLSHLFFLVAFGYQSFGSAKRRYGYSARHVFELVGGIFLE